MAARRAIRGIFLDLSGTCFLGETAIPGAAEAIGRARAAGMALRFVTNSTEFSAKDLHNQLNEMGVPAQQDDIVTAPLAAKQYLAEKSLRPVPLIDDVLFEDFKGVDFTNPNAVLVGLAPDKFDYAHLDLAFNVLFEGGELIAINKGRYDRVDDGSVHIGAGPFVTALEYAAGVEATVVGKPSKNFFHSALAGTGLDADQCVMIGDDVKSDTQGGLRAGLSGILVQTGKYTEGDEKVKEGPVPTFVAPTVAEAIDWALQNSDL